MTTATAPALPLKWHVDRYVSFQGRLQIEGWAFLPGGSIRELALLTPAGTRHAIDGHGLRSPDVEAAHGAEAAACRFAASVDLMPGEDPTTFQLAIVTSGGVERVSDFVRPSLRADPANRLRDGFRDRLAALTSTGRLLELGSRARSGVVHRDRFLPPGWDYVGFDLLPGPNVDVVGDAHRLSARFGAEFDGVASISVMEHLLMPWKVAVEVNRVLKPGGLALFATHQCWPLHDRPADFWRFSADAWPALFNRATGFEVVETAMGQPAHVVADLLHPAVAFGGAPAGFLSSVAVVRKIGDAVADWPVEDAPQTRYPDA